MTCYEKRDHSGYFIEIEFLAWIDSSMCAESNGATFQVNNIFNNAHNCSLHVATL